MFKAVCFTSFIILSYTLELGAQSWQSSLVQMDPSGQLTYTVDGEGNRIPDFSFAGYRNSETDLPIIQIIKIISPGSGDDTQQIQNAIDEIGDYELDPNGFRGALYLAAGEYEIQGTLYLNKSGIVLRGAGDGSDANSNTILKATTNEPAQRTVLIAGGGVPTAWSRVNGNMSQITTALIPVGSRTFEVEDAEFFEVGDNIIIYHPCTEEWLQAIDYGSPHGDPNWTVNSQPLIFNRYIESIDANEITIDAPVFNHLNRSLSQSYIYKYGREGLVTNIGIEDLRIEIDSNTETNENHAWNALDLYQIEDAWVKNCTMLHFGESAIRTNTATRITIENCQALDPHSIIEGSKRYNFQLYTASQLILFKDCYATNGRHHYISNGTSSVSGCVFYNCKSSGAYTSSEGHRRWSMGLLFDNHLELNGPRLPFWDPRLLGLYNRGSYGTSHGWGTAHSVCWNCDVAEGDIAIQKPPTAQNYAIGCFANQVTGTWFLTCPFSELEGYIEGTNRPGLEPASLFEAQLNARLSSSPGQTDPIVDTFNDGNFTVNPVWNGDIDKWQIIRDSDVSSGASYSYTLRLNETDAVSGTKYLSTQRRATWGSNQSWGVWIGRRFSAASDANQSIVWLWANEADLTSPTVDGYRLRFGDNVGDDEIILQRVDNSNIVNNITSSSAIPNGLTDIGFLVRVTRTESSEWTLYTSVLPTQNGQGAIATNIPAASITGTTVVQESGTDDTYTNFSNGYFGFMAIHDSDNDSRTGAEFDQLYFDISSDAALPVQLISFTATPGDKEVELNWSTASEIGNVGFIILRGHEEHGDYPELASYRKNHQLIGAGNSSEEHSYQYTDFDVVNSVTYWYKLMDVHLNGEYSEYGPIPAVPGEKEAKPQSFYLTQNYPNPFNQQTQIKFALKEAGVTIIRLYDVSGRLVETILERKMPAGEFELSYTATGLASGVYFYQLHVNDFRATRKMILVQ
jgi:hypothetical protein